MVQLTARQVYKGPDRQQPIPPGLDITEANPSVRIIHLSARDDTIVTVVDADLYDILSQWQWHLYNYGGKLYAKRTRRKGERGPWSIYMHRWIAEHYLPPPPTKLHFLVDHARGFSLDNRLGFLRWATPQENARNKWGMWWEQKDWISELERQEHERLRAPIED